ncbi:MAG: serine/threonine protein kinase [Verrucomicrobiae bacterium]|nr:serine/threonine protein kinase [Verrucomicrobiae bacterium]
MAEPTHSPQCGKCGAPLSGYAPDGLCAACLLECAIEVEPPLTPSLSPTGGEGGVSPGGGEFPPLPQPNTKPPRPDEESPGSVIGRYKLLEKIGEGGFGVVYVAEQREPVKRRVALKIIKLGMDTRQVVARFEAERQALAMMDHPNIAKVFDAGATETGRLYFVMELVRGIRITEYCDQHNLSTPERLELFIKVCQAIQHAHQKGIIHRDIKPSNILVTVNDGVPVPKVIDFGIAKATQGELTDKTVYTQFQQFIGTPAYMSPEQAEMTSLDIDTRSDIYALGVLLYELLTSKTPFEQKDLLKAGLDGMRRMIREQEPARPSTRVSSLGDEERTTTARRRGLDAHKLVHLLRLDLDWIVMKCLEKDRTRRYETANGLAADIRRHLENVPVIACPPSAVYRFQKMVRRNKLAFAATAAVATALVIGLGFATIMFFREAKARGRAQVQEQEAREAEAQARAILEFFQRHVLAVARPAGEPNAISRDVTVREALIEAEKQISATFSNQPLIEAQLRETLGETFWYLGDVERSLVQCERALELFRAKLGPDAKHTLTTMNNLANAYENTGQFEKALPLAEAVMKRLQEIQGMNSRDTLIAMHGLAYLYHSMGDDEKALPLELKTLELRKRALGVADADTLSSMDCLGMIYMSLGQITNAIAICEESVAIARTNFSPDDPTTLSAMANLASAYQRNRQVKDALPLRKAVLERRQRIYGPKSSQTLISMMNLASAYELDGDIKAAIDLNEKVLGLRLSELEPDHPDTYYSMHNLAAAYSKGGRLPEAIELAKKTVEGRRKKLGPDHPETLKSMSSLAVYYQDEGQFSNAIPIYEQTFALAESRFGANHPTPLEFLHKLAFAYYEAGQWSNAIPKLQEALKRYQAQTGETSGSALVEMTRLGVAYAMSGQSNQSAQMWMEFVSARKNAPEADALAVANTLAQYVTGLLERNRMVEAEQPARACLAIRETFIPDDWRTFNTRSQVGGVFLGLKQHADAEPMLLSGYEGMKLRESRIPNDGKVRLKEALERLVQLYETAGQAEKAADWKKKLVEFDESGLENPSQPP